jgi:hypothetical protein
VSVHVRFLYLIKESVSRDVLLIHESSFQELATQGATLMTLTLVVNEKCFNIRVFLILLRHDLVEVFLNIQFKVSPI